MVNSNCHTIQIVEERNNIANFKLVPGVTDDLVRMVIETFATIPEYKDRLPDNPKEKLQSMPWCVGFYKGSECVAALWGSEFIQLVVHPRWQRKFINKSTLKQFFDYFFQSHQVARVEGDGYNYLWKRLGFREYGGNLWALKRDIKWI